MPAQSSVTFNPPLRDVRGRFAVATKELLEDKRKAARFLGRRWVEIAQEEAPKGKTGKYRKSINFRTFIKQGNVGFTTSSMQPLGRWIIGGTKRHRIYPRKKDALFFFWPRIGKFAVVPRGGGFKTHIAGGKLWIGKGYVEHPGTKPNPYLERTYLRWESELESEINKVALRFVKTITGKSDK